MPDREYTFSVSLSTHVKGQARPEPVWELRYRVNGKQSDKRIPGVAWVKRGRPPKGHLTKTEAEQWAMDFLDGLARTVSPDRLTFGRAIEEFLVRLRDEQGRRETTVHEYRRMAERLSKRVWKGERTWHERPLSDFASKDLVALRDEMRQAGLNPHTINQYRTVVRGAFGDSPTVAAWKWMPLKKRRESKGKIRFYTPTQMQILLEHAADDRDRAIYVMGAELGLRINEIRGLKITQVDFRDGLVRLEDGYTDHGGHAGTKDSAVRALPLTPRAREYLWPLCAGRTERDSDGESTLVFTELIGQPLDYHATRRRLMKAIKTAGLPHLTLHELRHTFGTQMIKKVDIYTLQRLMGHEKIETTQIYLHHMPRPDLANVMASIWDGSGAVDGEVIPLRGVS